MLDFHPVHTLGVTRLALVFFIILLHVVIVLSGGAVVCLGEVPPQRGCGGAR